MIDPAKVTSRPAVNYRGVESVAVYYGRQRIATLHFSAKNCAELREAELAIATLYLETIET